MSHIHMLGLSFISKYIIQSSDVGFFSFCCCFVFVCCFCVWGGVFWDFICFECIVAIFIVVFQGIF